MGLDPGVGTQEVSSKINCCAKQCKVVSTSYTQSHRSPTYVQLVLSLLVISASILGNGSAVAQRTLPTASISIDASHPAGTVSPLLYGQFIEHMFEGVKFGLHAELLRNRGFEEQLNITGLSRYWERYPDDRNDDYALQFRWDEKTHYPETDKEDGHSLRVVADNGVIPRHGIFQSRVPVRAGIEYTCSVWMRTNDFSGNVKLALERDSTSAVVYSEGSLAPTTGPWRKYEVRLRPSKSDSLARLVIAIEGKGELWIDQVSLIPGDSIDGVRRDVFDRVKALKPAFIRWPGGNVAQDYHWEWAIGPRDARKSWINLSWKNEMEPSDFGTAEFVLFSRNVDAEPAITVNVEGRGATAEEAAAWVEYCNGPASSKYGALRAAHGYPQPFNVRFWEVGNEIWGSWVRGHSDAETYARNFTRYAEAMRKVDPTIKLIAVGDNDMKWNRTIVARAGKDIDYLAIHHYYGRREMNGDLSNLMARPLFYEAFYRQVAQLLNEISPEHKILLAINEWGLDLPVGQQYSMLSALYGARLMNVFERSNGLVAMSAVSDLINGWPGGIIQAGRDGVFVSPIYLVNQLYATNSGTELLTVDVKSEAFDSTREGKSISYLDAVANRSADHKWIFLKVVNSNLREPIATTIAVRGVALMGSVDLDMVNGARMIDANSFAAPEAVRIIRSSVPARSRIVVTLPAHSVTVLRFRTKGV